MRINSKEQIADVEILKVRDLLRRVNNTDEWEDDFVVDRLKILPKKANRLINELNRRGYIEPIRIYRHKQFYRKTLKGSTLGLASAAKPVTRKTANRIFSEFMDRVRQVNSDPSFLVKVKKVKRADYLKWLIWVPWIGSIVLLAIRSGGYNKIDFFYMTTHGLSIGDIQSLISYFFVLLLLIVTPAFVVGSSAPIGKAVIKLKDCNIISFSKTSLPSIKKVPMEIDEKFREY